MPTSYLSLVKNQLKLYWKNELKNHQDQFQYEVIFNEARFSLKIVLSYLQHEQISFVYEQKYLKSWMINLVISDIDRFISFINYCNYQCKKLAIGWTIGNQQVLNGRDETSELKMMVYGKRSKLISFNWWELNNYERIYLKIADEKYWEDLMFDYQADCDLM